MIRPVLAARGQIGGALAAAGGSPKWWLAAGVTPVAAYQPKGAASLAASYVNLANPGTNDAAPGVAPTWDATDGWTFNGTNQWLDTGLLPGATTSAVMRFSDVTGSEECIFGSYSGNDTTRFTIYAILGTQVVYEHANSLLVTPSLTAGTLGIAGQQGYRNGAADGGAIPGPWSGTATATIGIAKQNGFTVFGALRCQAFVIYDTTLDAAQVALVSAAMAAL